MLLNADRRLLLTRGMVRWLVLNVIVVALEAIELLFFSPLAEDEKSMCECMRGRPTQSGRRGFDKLRAGLAW